MKKVYIIHENTKGMKLVDKYVQVVTGYVCCIGYLSKIESDDAVLYEYDPIYMYPDDLGQPNVELENKFPGLWFETYEEGAKVLTKFLHNTLSYYPEMKQISDMLSDRYPEVIV